MHPTFNPHPKKEAQDYWDNALNWSGRTKLLRKLEFKSGLFNCSFAELPRLVQLRISHEVMPNDNVENEAKQG